MKKAILALVALGLCAAQTAALNAATQLSDEQSALRKEYAYRLVKIFVKLSIQANNRSEALARPKVQGTTVVSFTINREGKIADSKVVTSSGNTILDEAALSVVSQAQGLPEFPPGITESTLTYSVPFNFKPPTPPPGTAQ